MSITIKENELRKAIQEALIEEGDYGFPSIDDKTHKLLSKYEDEILKITNKYEQIFVKTLSGKPGGAYISAVKVMKNILKRTAKAYLNI